MRNARRISLYLAISIVFVALAASVVFAQDEIEASTPLEKAVVAVGGEEALQGLTGFSIEATGVRWVQDEGFAPGGNPVRIGAYTVTVSYDIANERLRLEQARETLGQTRSLTEVATTEGGYMDGVDGRFGAAAQTAMLADRWVSTWKQQWLLNPQTILLEILSDPSLVTDAGEVLYDGAVYHRLEVEGGTAPLTLYIHAGTGQLAKVTTTEETPLRQDVDLEVFYYDWQPIGESGIAFPAEVYIAVDEEIVVKEVRSSMTVNPELADDLFAFPDGIEPVMDEELIVRGESNHQYLQTFAHFGFIHDGVQTTVTPTEIAPGVYHLTGGSHNSLVVEQAGGIVVIDTPLGGYRSDLILEWIAATFPDKPVSYATITHHHEDHAAGLREFVANGATAVVHESAADFFAGIFDAPSTITPDTMADSQVDYLIETIPADDIYTLDDGEQPVELYPFDQTHAEDMVMAYLPNSGIVFVTDIYSPNPAAESAGPGGLAVAAAIDAYGLEVSQIVGGHGGVINFEDFEAQLD